MAALSKTAYGDNLIKRGKKYSYIYTVPQAHITKRGGRRQIVKALGTSDYEKAKVLAKTMRMADDLEYGSNDFSDVQKVYIEHVVETAKRFGFDYVEPKKIADSSISDFIELTSPAVEARLRTPRPNLVEVATFGSAIEAPAYRFSKVFPRFKEIERLKTKLKNEVDARSYWRRYERYAEDFIEQMGDMDVLKIDQDTVDKYRDTLSDRVMNDEFKSEYANKGMRYIRSMLKTVMKRDLKGVLNPFREFDTIDVDDATKRVAFTESEVRLIREKLKDSTIPEEAKAVIMISQNTGLGVKELCQMAPEDVCLDGGEEGIVHLKIRKNKFRNYLKTKDRERDIALIGDALVWMQKFPRGFENYTDPRGPRRLNRHIQKFIKETVPEKYFIAYRHRIAELMRNSDFKDQFQNAVMGHATPGRTGYYGGKVWLENTHRTLMETLPIDNR